MFVSKSRLINTTYVLIEATYMLIEVFNLLFVDRTPIQDDSRRFRGSIQLFHQPGTRHSLQQIDADVFNNNRLHKMKLRIWYWC